MSRASREEQFDIREEYFSKNREVLQSKFLKAKNDVRATCVGFFLDPRHLAGHFSWLTSSSPLNIKIEENLFRFLDNLFKVISHKDRSVQFENEMKKIDISIQLDFNGSRTYKDIEIIRHGCVKLDNGRKPLYLCS